MTKAKGHCQNISALQYQKLAKWQLKFDHRSNSENSQKQKKKRHEEFENADGLVRKCADAPIPDGIRRNLVLIFQSSIFFMWYFKKILDF